jgi:hypothetical protein
VTPVPMSASIDAYNYTDQLDYLHVFATIKNCVQFSLGKCGLKRAMPLVMA